MKKILITFGVIIIIIIISSMWLSSRDGKVVPDGQLSTEDASVGAWIEIESTKVSRIDEAGTELGPLNSGDSVTEGTIIRTDTTGVATVYFADGSNLRIDPNSQVEISEAQFDENTGSLRVKVALVIGKVWSKITALATPESHWEVKTGTAVATVRGSAFGTEVDEKGETNIVGSEHDVFVTPIDEVSGEELIEAQVIVTEKETLVIRKEIIKEIKNLTPEERKDKATKLLTRKLRSDDSKLQDWVRQNEEKDGIIRERIEELKVKGLESKELRKELKTFIRKEFRTELKSRLDQKIEQKVNSVSERTGLPKTNLREEVKTRILEEVSAVVSLEVRTRTGLKAIEGTTIQFEAVAILSDGTKKVVTDRVNWQVVGSIGSIIQPGVFQATLGADVSEIGTAFGAVTASFKSENGKEFIGKSGIITVIAAPPDPTTEDLRG